LLFEFQLITDIELEGEPTGVEGIEIRLGLNLLLSLLVRQLFLLFLQLVDRVLVRRNYTKEIEKEQFGEIWEGIFSGFNIYIYISL
jgi:hypothetical protein